MHFATEFQGVFTRSVGDVIHELRDRIGPLKFRPLEPAEPGEEVTAKTNARQAAGVRSAYARIQPVGRSRSVEIARQGRLVQPVVANAGLIDPTGLGVQIQLPPTTWARV